MNKKIFSGPFLIFIICGTIVPLGVIAFYGLTDRSGSFTFDNILAIATPEHREALLLALGLLLSFAVGLNIGASVVTARLFGARRIGQMKTAVNTAFLLCLAVCAALMTLGFLFSPALIRAIQTPPEIFEDTMLYLNIYTGGLAFLFFYNIATGIFASLGDSRTPFLFLAASSVANIALDVLFVTALNMGVAGVAWATFLCQGVSCVLAVLALLRTLSRMEEDEPPRLFSPHILVNLVKIALPSTLQQCFISVGNILIQSIINGFGTSAIAGYAAAVKFNNFAVTSFTTMGNGMSNFTAQNLGAMRPDRVREGYRGCVKMMAGIATLFAAVYVFLGDRVIRLFLNGENTQALAVGTQFLRIIAPFYYLVALKLACDGVLRGAGRMGEFMTDTFVDLAMRVALSFALSVPLGLTGVWWSWPVSWAVATAIAVLFYRRGRWAGEEKA